MQLEVSILDIVIRIAVSAILEVTVNLGGFWMFWNKIISYNITGGRRLCL